MAERLLQVRPGEGTRAALLFLYLFLVVTAYVGTKATRDALFLGRYGAARLPLADMASALAVAAAMAMYLRVGRVAGVRATLIRTLLVFAGSSLGFWALSGSSEQSWVLPALYIWASVFGVLLPAQVWTLANYVTTTREAKRLFGVVGSGAICGWIAGGALTSAAATRFGASSLLLVTAVALAVCPLFVVALWRERRVDDDGPSDAGRAAGVGDVIGVVWKSPYLRAIAAVVGVSSLVTTIAAWQFRAIAKQAIADTNELTAFFGTFSVYAGALSLAAQLLVRSRLLRRWGIGVALLVVPVALTAGSLAVLIWSSLWTAVVLKGGDQVLRYSIDRSTVELLYLPVPARDTFRVKAVIDAVVWRAGDWLGALVVLIGVTIFGATARSISVVNLALLAAWAAAAVFAARGYVTNLHQSIYEHRLDVERLSERVIDRSTSDVLARALGSETPDDILYALGLLADREGPIPLDAVRRLVDHPSAAIRRKAIAVLAAARDVVSVPRVEPRLDDDDPAVRAEALLYLTRMTDVDPLARLDDLERVSGPAVASALAFHLSRPGPGQNLDAVRLLLDTALRQRGPDGEFGRFEAASLVVSLPIEFSDELQLLLEDPSCDVARLALRAAAAVGASAVPALRAALDDEDRPADLRAEIPVVLQRIGTPEAEQALVEHLLDRDPRVRLRVVSALNKLRQLYPARRLERELIETVLAAEIIGHYRSYELLDRWTEGDPLPESMNAEIVQIFRLVKLLFPDDDLHSVYVGLRSGSARVRANALEFIEHTLPARIRTALLPLIDNEVTIVERVRLAHRIVGLPVGTPASEDVAALLRETAADARGRLGSEKIL